MAAALQSHLDTAAEHVAHDRFDDALNIYEQLLDDYPNDPDVCNDAAITYYHLDRPDEAIACLEHALENDPGYEGAFFNLMDLTLEHEGRKAAAERFEQFGGAIPRNAEKTIRFLRSVTNDQLFNSDGEIDQHILHLLQQLWGNQTWAAPPDYVRKMSSLAATSTHSILECGSGLTTLVLGLVTRNTDQSVWALEHHPQWHDRVRTLLNDLELDHIHLCSTPLISYDQFDWYDAPLDEMPEDFGLVICDGPPGTTRGGRYGMMPVMRARLASGATILMDDIGRSNEQEVVRQWRSMEPLSVEIYGNSRKFAVLQLSEEAESSTVPSVSVNGHHVSSSHEKAPIFIGGAGRSGTSLLRTILNAHSRIAIGAEFKVTPMIAQFWRQLSQHREHLQEYFFVEQDDINAAVGDLIQSLLHKFHEHSGKPRLGEKTPNNVMVFPQLHGIFPKSPLLHIIRDGRDVVRSLLQQNWQSRTNGDPVAIIQDPEAATAYWKKAVTAGQRAAQQSKTLRQRHLEIRYEDLVTEPENIVRQVLDHIGEPWEPEVLCFHEKDDPSVYENIHRPISDASVGKWKSELTSDQKSILKRMAGDLLIDLGYARDLDW